MSNGLETHEIAAPVVQWNTLVELVRYRATRQPNQCAYTFLEDGETQKTHLTYGELDRQARAIAAQLQELKACGERVLLLYPQGLEYIAAFFGCLYAGALAVPAYPPTLSRPSPRIQGIVADAQPKFISTTAAMLPKLQRWFQENSSNSLQWLATDTLVDGLAENWREPSLNPEALAFLQYTSGSTAAPKGVMVSHANLLHNEHMIATAFRFNEQSVGVGWLPLFHDMGLIGLVLQPLYLGFPCYLMSPVAFLQEPARWLQAISHYRGTISPAPNFAYDLCIQKITPE